MIRNLLKKRTNYVTKHNKQEGIVFGLHLIIDICEASNLNDKYKIKDILGKMALKCKSTLLDIRIHEFGCGMGITGIAFLAESHISIHT